MSRGAAFVLAALVAGGTLACDDGGAPGGGPPTADLPSTVDSAETPDPTPDLSRLLDHVHDRTPDGKLRVLDELPAPASRAVEAVENRHDPAVTDTVRILRWPGLTVEVYHATTSGREMIRSVEVTGEDYRTGRGLRVGMSRSDVAGIVGSPVRTRDGGVVYELREGEHDPTPTFLTVHYAGGGRVERLAWSFYID